MFELVTKGTKGFNLRKINFVFIVIFKCKINLHLSFFFFLCFWYSERTRPSHYFQRTDGESYSILALIFTRKFVFVGLLILEGKENYTKETDLFENSLTSVDNFQRFSKGIQNLSNAMWRSFLIFGHAQTCPQGLLMVWTGGLLRKSNWRTK